ncbi:MCP four helix bundle domain-containing protein [Ekhidna sp.]|uniref:MCP four helix bundle domain-containing protein n=1 Tax=Ekhidna sp. TaxID=2608089 RepID=UPI003CCC2532
MRWKLSLAQRIRAGAALAVVFLLIIATNLIDKNHFRIVKENLTTVYEDRLLAKNYLYRISRNIQQKKEILQSAEANNLKELHHAINDSIDILIDKFASTKLTERESIRFTSLQENIRELKKFENAYVSDESIAPEAPISTNSEQYFQAVFQDLDALFKIQLEESSRVISSSNQTIQSSDLITKLEIGALIVIGILIQLLIFLKPSKHEQ